MADEDLIYGLARRHYLGLAGVFSKYPHIGLRFGGEGRRCFEFSDYPHAWNASEL